MKGTCYLKHQEAQQRSASADGITRSARGTCETEILSRLLGGGGGFSSKLFVIFCLPSNQSGEKLQKRKCLLML